MIIISPFSGYSRDGRRTYFKGGESSGSNYYANQDKLLGVQADIAEGMYNNIYQPNAPAAVARLGDMTTDASTGALTTRARNTAGADAGQALGAGLSAAQRTMDRYGTTMNPNMLAANVQDASIDGAAMISDAMNKATKWGEDQKWARNYDFYNSLSGVPSQSTSALGSAASGYGAMGNGARQTDMANAQGMGQFGGSMAYALTRADGGAVSKTDLRRKVIMDKGVGIHLASGGLPQLAPWRSRASSVPQGGEGPSAIGSIAAGAAPVVLANMAKPVVKMGLDAAAKGIGTAAGEMTNAAGIGMGNSGVAAPVVDATMTPVATNAATTAATTAGTETATAAGTTAATTAATDAAATTAATTAAEAGGTAMATLGTVMPWVGAGLLAANALGIFDADGGPISENDPRLAGDRANLKPGGAVDGKGTATSDDIPAWLSDGEYVLNAETVKMVGKNKLDMINKMGLKARGDEGKKSSAGRYGMGGMLGVSLGAGVNEWNNQKKMALDANTDQRAQAQLELAQGQDARQAEEHGIRMTAEKAAAADAQKGRDVFTRWQSDRQKIASGAGADVVAARLAQYNANQGAFADGAQLIPQSTPSGDVLNHVNKDGQVLDTIPMTQENQLALLDKSYDQELKFTSPMAYQHAQSLQTAAAEKAADRKMHTDIAAGNNATTRDVATGNNSTSVSVANINERGANARNAASVGVQRDQLDINKAKDSRAEKLSADGAQALADMDTAEQAGNASAYKDARNRAIRAGIKLDKPISTKADFTPNPMGMGGTVKQILPDGSVVVTPMPMDAKGPIRIGAPGSAPSIATDPRAIAIRDDKSLTIPQKKAKLLSLGYQ